MSSNRRRREVKDSSEVAQDLKLHIKQPEGLALDWAGSNMYWTDAGGNSIEMARTDGRYQRTVIKMVSKLMKPKAIVLDPDKG